MRKVAIQNEVIGLSRCACDHRYWRHRLFAPDALLSFGRYSVSSTGLHVIAAIRVAMGIVLIAVASHSRFPTTLRLFGGVAIIAGLTTPLLGVAGARAMLNWWTLEGSMALRSIAVLIVAVGCFIAYAMAAGRRPATN